jgi:hypothetical protein
VASPVQASTSKAGVVGDVVATLGSSDAKIVVTHRVREQQRLWAAPAPRSWLLSTRSGSETARGLVAPFGSRGGVRRWPAALSLFRPEELLAAARPALRPARTQKRLPRSARVQQLAPKGPPDLCFLCACLCQAPSPDVRRPMPRATLSQKELRPPSHAADRARAPIPSPSPPDSSVLLWSITNSPSRLRGTPAMERRGPGRGLGRIDGCGTRVGGSGSALRGWLWAC